VLNGRSGPCWKFTRPKEDLPGAATCNAASIPGPARLGTWTQLTGVFNATQGMLLLYVNGVRQREVGSASPWSASPPGYLRIGDLMPGGQVHDWSGRISDGCAFYGPLGDADVKLLHRANGCAALHAKYP
jgi:hypothetical protein